LRIGIDATCLPGVLAGVGRYIHGIIHGLANVDSENEYFIFLKAQDQRYFRNLPANMRLVCLPNLPRPVRLVWQHLLAGERARELRLDFWHGPHYTLPNFLNGIPAVVTFHDLGFHLYPQFYSSWKRVYFRYAITQAAKTAHQIVTDSRATADQLRSLADGHFALPPESGNRIRPIVSGIDASFFDLTSQQERDRVRQQYARGSPFVLFVGTMEKRKNLAMLIEAFQRFCARGHEQHILLLAGQSGNGSQQVAAAIDRHRMHERVRCVGYVQEQDLRALYQAADLFVLPSLYEGFGFPLLEAMAGGGVVLATDTPAVRELAGHSALLCAGNAATWADRMEEMLFDRQLRRKIAGYGPQRAQRFSWQRAAAELVEVYESAHRQAHVPARIIRAPLPLPDASRNGNAHIKRPPRIDLLSTSTEQAVLRTLAFADLFDYPMTADEIHYGLFDLRRTRAQVSRALMSLIDQARVARLSEYYFLPGKHNLVKVREERRKFSLRILRRNRWILRLIQSFPFVNCVAISGAMAFENCREDDDVDLFLIVNGRRLWTVYSGLALMLKFLRKRRTMCLNCLVGTSDLTMDDRDFYVAHQIAFLLPCHRSENFRKFFHANAWCLEYLPQMNPERRRNHPLVNQLPAANGRVIRRTFEAILGSRVFDILEKIAFHFYRRRIHHLARGLDPQSVEITPGQIKLFTNDHRRQLQNRLARRMQELAVDRSVALEEAELSPAID